MITKTSLSKEPMLYIGFMGGPIVTKDLVGPRTFGGIRLHTMNCCRTRVFDETAFHANRLVTNVPLPLYFARL